jgi:RNA polymerase sigma-70 factor (ECF subfamily)
MTSSPSRQATDRLDFEALYQQHSREVWAFVYARHLNADLALDLMQEAFLRLWRQVEQGETILNARAWLLKVAHNLAEDHAKSAFTRNGTLAPQLMNGVHSREAPPLENLVQQEAYLQVRNLLEQLSAADREILTLRYALDYSTPQIAEALSINATAVHMRLSRARQRMADKLASIGVNQVS